MKLTIDNINLLKDKKILTHVISADDIIKKYDTVESLKIADLITLADPTEMIENAIETDVDYTSKYFTTKAVGDGKIYFNIGFGVDTDMIRSISYSIDGGSTWVTTENEDYKDSFLSISVNVKAGDEVLWKGDATQLSTKDSDFSFFDGSAKFSVYGNIMSLLYGDNFADKTTLNEDYCFHSLFRPNGDGGSRQSDCVDASNLILPATTLTTSCYAYMFYDSLLTAAPKLPATRLVKDCYASMFKNCNNLNHIECYATTGMDSACSNWVSGVAATGTFKRSPQSSWQSGVNGIPMGWTVDPPFEDQ